MLNRRSRRTCNAGAGAFARLNANGGAGGKTRNSGAEVIGAAKDEGVGMVKGVKGIRTEFQAVTLRNKELLVDAEVGVPGAGTAEDIAAGHVRRIGSEFGITGDGVGELTHGRVGKRDVVEGIGSGNVRERSRPWNWGIQDQPRQLLELNIG